MKKLMLTMLALMALMISVPAIARDANQDSLKQDSATIKSQQKALDARFKALDADAARLMQKPSTKSPASETAK
jgi:peptidoglycan hydrolase CwlO-like protein